MSKVSLKDCKHLPISYYNHNYYELPYEYNGCSILYEEFDGGENFCGYSLGVINNSGQYEYKFYLYAEYDSEIDLDDYSYSPVFT